MKICLLSDAYPPDVGGLAVSSQRLADGLSRRGHSVHVCVRDALLPPGRLRREQPMNGGAAVHRLGVYKQSRDTLTDWCELALRLGREQGIQLYHGFFLAYAGFVAAYSARLLGAPSVISARGNDLDRLIFDAARAPFILEALRLASAVTAVSSELAAKVRALAPQARVYLTPNGVDAELFCPGPPTPRWEARPGFTLGFVGEARVKKGLATLLEALTQTAAVRPLHLVLVGGVRTQDRPLLDLFVRQQPHLSVQTTPYLAQQDLPGVYNALDLVLLPSLRDGLPNALLEAMACARPVLGAPVGGITDVLQDGVNGFLTPPADAAALAGKILALLEQTDSLPAVGAAARQTVLQSYTLAHELEANLNVYQALGV